MRMETGRPSEPSGRLVWYTADVMGREREGTTIIERLARALEHRDEVAAGMQEELAEQIEQYAHSPERPAHTRSVSKKRSFAGIWSDLPDDMDVTPQQDVITLEPGKHSGKPAIRGMRITVYDILSYLAAGTSHQEILADFPYLTEEDITEEDIRAALSYAADRERSR